MRIILDSGTFYKHKSKLNGYVFWRELPGGKIEIKQAHPHKET
jgi:hypothetical protein